MKHAYFKMKLIWSAILALSISACGFVWFENNPTHCSKDIDCPLDQQCNLETNKCVDRNLVKPSSIVDFELIPESGSGAVVTQIPQIDLQKVDIENIQLELATAIRVQGNVSSPEKATRIGGTLVITKMAAIKSRPLIWNITVPEVEDFSASLSSGEYQFLFKPVNRDNFPQLLTSPIEITANDENFFTIEYPEYLNLQTESGMLEAQNPIVTVRGRVLESYSSPQPIQGLVVEGISHDNLKLRTNRTNPDGNGYFYLNLPVHLAWDQKQGPQKTFPQSLDIVIQSASLQKLLFPTIYVSAVPLTDADIGTFYTGEIPFDNSVDGMALAEDGTPIANCSLRFEGQNIGNGMFTTQTQTAEDGTFSTRLLQGTYQVTAVPPVDSKYQMANHTVSLETGINYWFITLPMRPILSGRVVDHENQPVANVIAQAKRISSLTGALDGVMRSYESLTDAAGYFQIPVDHGYYQINLIPSSASGLARSFPKAVYVFGNEDIQLNEQDTKLPAPAVIKGVVFSPLSGPVCGVSINVFQGNGNEDFLVGQTISSQHPQDSCQGSYTAIIPETIRMQE